jgi:hypothetical protein
MIRIDVIWLATEQMDARRYRNSLGASDLGVQCGEAALCLSVRQLPGQPDVSAGARWRRCLACSASTEPGHVIVAKFADHLPLYRQEKIFGRAGLAIARSTLPSELGKPACGSSLWSMHCVKLC